MTRNEIEALLPFLANDTLEGDERAEVEAAVAADAQLTLELEALRSMRQAMQADAGQGPGELGLARLMREVEAQPPKTANSPTAPSGWSRVWQVAAVVAFLALAAQSLFVWQGSDPNYELAGGEAGAEGPVLVVAFLPDAREAEIRTLLLELGLEIVGGPSALGLYRVAVFDADDLEAARAGLEAAAIVENVSDD